MTGHSPEALASRIHQPSCPWIHTNEHTEDVGQARRMDPEAVDILEALERYAQRSGLPPTENNNHSGRRHPTHRCPVGDRVSDDEFSDDRPKPWTGELCAQSSDGRMLFRLYFIERRPKWDAPTELIVGCGIGTKPVAEDGSWTSADQTADILKAMNSGIEYCLNTKHVWRRWNSA